MRIRISLFVLFLTVSTINAQQLKLDSLKQELTVVKEDSLKFKIYDGLIRGYLSISMDSTRVYNDKLLTFSQETRQKEIAIKGYNLASTYYYYNSQVDSCLFYVEKAMTLLKDSDNYKLQSDLYRKLAILSRVNKNFEAYEEYALLALDASQKAKDWNLHASALVVVGNVYYNQNEYASALQHYIKIDSIHTVKNEISSNLSLALENIALIYISLKDSKALEYLEKSKKVHKQLKNKAGIANIDRIRASYYSNLKQTDSVIAILERVSPFYESYNEPNKLIEVYTQLVMSYAENGFFEKALPILNKSAIIIERPGFNGIGKNQYYYTLGVYHLQKRNYLEAINAFKKAKAIIIEKETDFYLGERKEITEKLAEAYSKNGNLDEAISQYKRLQILKDSLNIQNQENVTRGLETKYQTEKKEQEIALLQAQNETVEAQKKNQRNLLLGGLGLTSIAGIFLFLGFRNRKKTNDKLRELDTMKSSFFENISHEFRTPLSLITGPIEEQLQKPDIGTSEKKNLNIAKRNTKRLLTLVDQLLDLSKVEAGHFKLKVQQGDLELFLRSLTSSFSYLAQENNQEYTSAIDIPENTYYFDADALEKIITNLISNALKYSPNGESIAITSITENKKLQITVQNSGATLSEEALQTIFNRFARTDEQTAGTGIGLALSKELVTLHKGTIHAQSAHDTTTFTITIPVTESAFTDSEKTTGVMEISAFAKAETTTSKEEIIQEEVDVFSKDNNPILLIVDDNADLRTYVGSLFEDQYTIHTAQDGQEGFGMASSIVPDLIITDLMMPKDDGITFTRNCKASETTSHIPIIMLTAKAGDENQLTGLETGADAYITKPFNTEILKTTTHNLLETRKKLQERFSQEVVLIPKDIAVNSADERFLDNLKEIVDTQIIESDFTSESFSKALGMSRMQLHRKLKALTGLSATEFIRSQRLKLAAQLLKKSDINVSQVGYAVGFNNHSYFTKCFKEHYGISPSDYAKKA